MSTDKQTNGQASAPMTKADKRARITELEKNLECINRLKQQVIFAEKRPQNGTNAGLFIKNEYGDATKLISPDFMSHSMYLKLYINECDESMARIEKELDDLTA